LGIIGLRPTFHEYYQIIVRRKTRLIAEQLKRQWRIERTFIVIELINLQKTRSRKKQPERRTQS